MNNQKNIDKKTMEALLELAVKLPYTIESIERLYHSAGSIEGVKDIIANNGHIVVLDEED